MVDFYTNAFSENMRTAKSKRFVTPADGTFNVVMIPRFTLVRGVYLFIETAYTLGTATLTVGFLGNGETADPDAFIVKTESSPATLGLKTSVGGTAAVASAGKYFGDKSGAITLTSDDNGGTSGKFYLFVDYSVIH